jgi:hypothetical protein
MLALDRFHFDRDSRLHVSGAALSAAGVGRYRGREIHDFERLGLDARREYRLLRDPGELRRAASSLSGLPLLSDHISLGSASHPRELVVGALGTDAYLDRDLRLRASMTIWTRAGIDGIASGKKRQLSLGSRFALDMTPGVFQGSQRYDGIMRDIEGHHVALVHRGRAGPDCGITTTLNNTENASERFVAA